jgi:hypothetical protein
MIEYLLIVTVLRVPRIPEPKKPIPVNIAQILIVEKNSMIKNDKMDT